MNVRQMVSSLSAQRSETGQKWSLKGGEMLTIPGLSDGYTLRLFEITKRTRRLHKHPTNDWSPVEQTYIQLKGKWKYFYRAIDSAGNSIDFWLSATQPKPAAQWFLCKALKATCGQSLRVILVDKNQRWPPSIPKLKAEAILAQTDEFRQNKSLNHL